MIKIVKYNSSNKELWNSFIENSNNGPFLFDRNFMEYHKDRFEDYSLLCFKNNKLVGLFPGNIYEGNLYSHQGLSYGGLVTSLTIQAKEYLEVFKELLSFLIIQGIEKIYLKCVPTIYFKKKSDEFRLVLQLLDAKRTRVDSYFAIEMIHGYQPNRNRKRALKIANDKKLIFREGGDLDYFWENILTENLNDRFGVNPTHSIEEIKILMDEFPNKIKFFSVYNGEELKAGVIMFLSQTVAHFQYSSGNVDRSDDSALDFLFDAIINKFKYKKYVSFGSSSEQDGLHINRGLAYWKESFGAKLQIQEYYTIETNNYDQLNNLYK